MTGTEQLTTKAKAWAIEKALPLWSDAGFDRAWGGFHEKLSMGGEPLTAAPRRLMVQARQIYVYAHADLLAWWPDNTSRLDQAVATMIERFYRADGEPGFVHSVYADGRIANPVRDTYAHAFALFAIGWSLRRRRNAKLEAVAEDILKVLDHDLACKRTGGYEIEQPLRSGVRLQNPHMHLMEAFLALYDGTQNPGYLARAGEIFGLLTARFLNGEPPVLIEYFDTSWQPVGGQRGRLWEPGHQMEWSWLLRWFAARSGRDVSRYAELLHARAWSQGRDADGFIVDECDSTGGATKLSRRCWPHTEAIKSLAVEFEHATGKEARADYAAGAATMLGKLQTTFLSAPIAGGWIDRIDAGGNPLVDTIPASSFYHIFLAIAEADRVFGPQNAVSG